MRLNFFNYQSARGKLQRVLLHILFWSVFFTVQYYIGQVSFNNLKYTPASYLNPLRVTICLMLIYYPLVYYVIPKFFIRKKYLLGVVAILFLIVIYATLDAIWEMMTIANCPTCAKMIKKEQPAYYDYLQRGIENVILSRVISLGIVYQLLLLIAPALGIKMGTIYVRQRLAALQLAKENTELEFNLLKAQVNPHFLFNTLNNIYALIKQDRKEESAEMVARLSNFMRYSLYKEEKENTIDKEIQLLKDYIELEKIRLNNTVVNFNYDIDNAALEFPPLLFIPLIENAFKFCTEETGKNSWILIQMNLNNRKIYCKISNTFNGGMPAVKGGIGLKNVRKRLQQHYNDKYSFDVKSEEPIFTVTIQINL